MSRCEIQPLVAEVALLPPDDIDRANWNGINRFSEASDIDRQVGGHEMVRFLIANEIAKAAFQQTVVQSIEAIKARNEVDDD